MPEFTIDMDQVKIPDLVLLERAGNRELSAAEMVAFLDRVVVGGVADVPITRIRAIVDAVRAALDTQIDPNA